MNKLLILLILISNALSVSACPVKKAWRYTWNQELIYYWIDPGLLVEEPRIEEDIQRAIKYAKPQKFARQDIRDGADIKIEIDNDISVLGRASASPQFTIENGTITVLPYFASVRCAINMNRVYQYPADEYNQRSNVLRNAVRHEFLHALNINHMKSFKKHVPLMVPSGGGSVNVRFTFDDKKAIREIYSSKKPVRTLRFKEEDIGKVAFFRGEKIYQVYISGTEIPVKYVPKGKQKRIIQ